MGMVIRVEERDWENKGCGFTAAWRVGMKVPVLPSTVKAVTEVEASGEELHYILTRFTGLPHCYRKAPAESIRWYGDHARFIVGNLVPNAMPEGVVVGEVAP